MNDENITDQNADYQKKKPSEALEPPDFDFPFGSPLANDSFSPHLNESRNVSNLEVFEPTGSSDEDDSDDARPSGSLELRVHNISKFRGEDFQKELKILSPTPTIIRCLPWKIIFMLRVNQAHSYQHVKFLGFFVQCNGESDSSLWHCHARAKLTLVAQKPGCSDLSKSIEHSFFGRENDWGYSSFISWNDLLNPEKGFVIQPPEEGETLNPKIEYDTLIMRVRVHADAPHGTEWDSKKFTGFVGLKNQGATCYMNSLLQALYFTNKLRAAVFKMPTENDDTCTSVPLALQRVFYELQFGDKAGNTKKLTRSFGWETFDSFMQHDAQELCRVLLDNMENKMKGTGVEGTIPNLFCGKMLSYIRCKYVPYESKREETFYDIQLKIKGNRNIYEAFDEYIAEETLEGDNKYDASSYGLQEAAKGVIFTRFPPVLYLQLMRFQYDCTIGANIKINDRFEFPYILDLSKYIASSEDSQEPIPSDNNRYVLHAVLVHSGDNHGGHYVAYLNPSAQNKWYKFDDDVVSRCPRKEAINSNFGGLAADGGNSGLFRQYTNAYMLVYLKQNLISDVLQPLTENDIPTILLARLREERRVEAMKRKAKAEAHLYTTFNLILDEDFYGWQDYDLCNFEFVPCRRIRVHRAATLEDLRNLVSETLNLDVRLFRLWGLLCRRNIFMRLTCLDNSSSSEESSAETSTSPGGESKSETERSLTENGHHVTAEISPNKSSRGESQAKVFEPSICETLMKVGFQFIWVQRCDLVAEPFDAQVDFLVFLKYYTPESRCNTACSAPGNLHYLGWLIIRQNTSIWSHRAEILRRAELPPDLEPSLNTDSDDCEGVELQFFEELREGEWRSIPMPKASIEACLSALFDGAIIVFQQVPKSNIPLEPSLDKMLDENPLRKRESKSIRKRQPPIPDPPPNLLKAFYRDICARTCVQFVEKKSSWYDSVIAGDRITVISSSNNSQLKPHLFNGPLGLAALDFGELSFACSSAFNLCLPQKTSYANVVKAMAQYLRCKPERLQLFRADTFTFAASLTTAAYHQSASCNMIPLPSNFVGTLKDLLALSFTPFASNNLAHTLHHHRFNHQQITLSSTNAATAKSLLNHGPSTPISTANSLMVQMFNQQRLHVALDYRESSYFGGCAFTEEGGESPNSKNRHLSSSDQPSTRNPSGVNLDPYPQMVTLPTFSGSNTNVLLYQIFYQRLSLPIQQLENLCQLRCMYVDSWRMQCVSYLMIFSPKNCTIGKLLEEIHTQLMNMSLLRYPPDYDSVQSSEDTDMTKLRLLEIHGSWIIQQFPEDRLVSTLQPYCVNMGGPRILRVESVPAEEQHLSPHVLYSPSHDILKECCPDMLKNDSKILDIPDAELSLVSHAIDPIEHKYINDDEEEMHHCLDEYHKRKFTSSSQVSRNADEDSSNLEMDEHSQNSLMENLRNHSYAEVEDPDDFDENEEEEDEDGDETEDSDQPETQSPADDLDEAVAESGDSSSAIVCRRSRSRPRRSSRLMQMPRRETAMDESDDESDDEVLDPSFIIDESNGNVNPKTRSHVYAPFSQKPLNRSEDENSDDDSSISDESTDQTRYKRYLPKEVKNESINTFNKNPVTTSEEEPDLRMGQEWSEILNRNHSGFPASRISFNKFQEIQNENPFIISSLQKDNTAVRLTKIIDTETKIESGGSDLMDISLKTYMPRKPSNLFMASSLVDEPEKKNIFSSNDFKLSDKAFTRLERQNSDPSFKKSINRSPTLSLNDIPRSQEAPELTRHDQDNDLKTGEETLVSGANIQSFFSNFTRLCNYIKSANQTGKLKSMVNRKRSADMEPISSIFSWQAGEPDSDDFKLQDEKDTRIESKSNANGEKQNLLLTSDNLNATAAWLQNNSLKNFQSETSGSFEDSPKERSMKVSQHSRTPSSSKRAKIMPLSSTLPPPVNSVSSEEDLYPIPSSLVVFCGHFIRGCADSSNTQLGAHPLTMPFTFVLNHNELVSEVRSRIGLKMHEALMLYQQETQGSGDSSIPGSLVEMFGPNANNKWRLVMLPGPVPDMPYVNSSGLLMTVSSSVVMYQHRVLSTDPQARIDLRDFCTMPLRRLLVEYYKTLNEKFTTVTTSDSGLDEPGSPPVLDLSCSENLPPMLASFLLAFSTRPWLAIEHRVLQKRPRYTFTEKPIKIFN